MAMLQTVETVHHPFTTSSNVKRILINDAWVRAASGKTFGGYKMSGYGRESGIQQMEEYLRFAAPNNRPQDAAEDAERDLTVDFAASSRDLADGAGKRLATVSPTSPNRLLKKCIPISRLLIPWGGDGVAMRGDDRICGSFLSSIDLEARVRAGHPLRPIREIANSALATLSGDFEALYSGLGRPSIPPENLLRAMLLQAFYSVRSERQLMARIEFDLVLRWFVGIGIDDPVWDHSSFSTNRDRLLDGKIAPNSSLPCSRIPRLLQRAAARSA